jgi:cytochrome c oxidase assembly factor 2
MPPLLHPRSRFTSSLFATTVFASFFVVALPHILPCPAPRLAYADGEMPDGTPQRRAEEGVPGSKAWWFGWRDLGLQAPKYKR